MPTARRLAPILAALSIACSGTHVGPDADTRADAGPLVDTGPLADAGLFADAGADAGRREDGGQPAPDAGAITACAPRHVGSLDVAGCFCSGPLIRHGDALYRQAIGIDVYDLSDPDEPRFVRTLEERGGSEGGLAIVGGHLISVTNFAPLLVHDLSDPLHPVRVAELDLGGYPSGIAVEGALAAVPLRRDEGGVAVVRIDLSDPRAPRVIGETEIGQRLNGPVVADAGRAWFVEVDVEVPGEPPVYALREVALTTGETHAHEVPEGGTLAAAGGLVYLASPTSALRIYEPRGGGLIERGRHDLDGRYTTAIEAEGGRVLVVSETLSVFDVSEPSRVRLLGESEPSFGGEWLRGSGTHAYLSNGSSLHVFTLGCE